ncbi:hypothetical protein BX600DRAFT_459459 [Xylariales sp. PMI_506]|nr:hypothetical protein BX600DRAFT_459459 [Xylariales sp. PMI_506]
MVITWQQFVCSKATKYQPQVLSLTGVVCRVDEDGKELEVMLARRDLKWEQKEKQYDYNTGERIYDKFDAPDLEDEDEEEEDAEETRRWNEGYRTLSFGEMMDPRLVQPAIPITGEAVTSTLPTVEPPQGAEPDTSLPIHDTTFEGFDDVSDGHPEVANKPRAHDEVPDSNGTTDRSEAIVTGTTNDSTQGQAGQAVHSSNVPMSDLSQISSPSQQKQGESPSQPAGVPSSETILANDPTGNDYTEMQVDVSPTVSSRFSSDHETALHLPEADIIAGTPKATNPQAQLLAPSPTHSAQSGRQPDFPMDLDRNAAEPLSLRGTTAESCDIDGQPITGAINAADASQGEIFSASQQTNQLDDPKVKVTTPLRRSPRQKDAGSARKSPPATPSTPRSIASLNTVWCTAATSRNARTPSKPQESALKFKSQPSQDYKDVDAEYQEAMRKLDYMSDDEDSRDTILAKDTYPLDIPDPATENTQQTNGSSITIGGRSTTSRKDAKISPPSISRRQGRAIKTQIPSSPVQRSARSRTRQSTQASQDQSFIPPGTQVLEISSDSDDPQTTEKQTRKISSQQKVSLKAHSTNSITVPAVKARPRRNSSLASTHGASKVTGKIKAASQGGSQGVQQSAAAVLKGAGRGRRTAARF